MSEVRRTGGPGAIRLLARRFRTQLAAQLGIAAVVLIVCLTGVITSIGLDLASTLGGRELLRDAPASQASLAVQTGLAADGSAQDAAMRSVFAQRFAGIPIQITRTVSVPPADLISGGNGTGSADPAAPRVLLEADPDLLSAVRVVSGEWPAVEQSTAPGPLAAAVQADAAQLLGIGVGDPLVVAISSRSVSLLVTALWEPRDPAASRWHGDPAPASGSTLDGVGPVILEESDLVTVPVPATVRWVVAPRIDAIEPGAIDRLARASDADGISEDIDRSGGIGVGGVSVDGGLADSAAATGQALAGARAISGIPLALVAALAIAALVQLGGLLASSRSTEAVVVRARGASSRQLLAAAVLEAAVVCLPSAGVGGLLGGVLGVPAAAAMLGTAHSDPSSSALDSSLGSALGLSIGLSAAIGVLSVVVVVASTGDGWWSRSTGAARGVPAGRGLAIATALAVLVAGVAVAQLVGAGRDAAGAVAAGAPVLAAVAGILLLIIAVRPLAAAIARRAAGARGLDVVTAARLIARQAGAFPAILLIAALSSGAMTMGAGIIGTAVSLDTRTADALAGADVRASYAVQGTVSDRSRPITAGAAGELDGVRSATIALSTTATVGPDTLQLMALPARAPAPGSGLRALDAGTPLTELRILVRTDAPAERPGAVAISAWLADDDGALARVPLGAAVLSLTRTAGVELSAPLPAASPHWRLLALDAELQASPGAAPVEVTLTSSDLAVGEIGAVHLSSPRPSARALVLSSAVAELPVRLSRAAAARAGLRVGDGFEVALSTGARIPARVEALADQIPGTSSPRAALVDLPTLDAAMLAATGPILQAAEVWVGTDSPDAVAGAIVRSADQPVDVVTRRTASVGAVLDPTLDVLLIGMLAAGAIGGVGFGAATRIRARRSAEEGRILVALGRSHRSERRSSAALIAVVTGYGLLAGSIAGAVAAAICGPVIARLAVPVTALPGSVSFAASGLAGVLLFVVLTALIIVLQSGDARPSARDGRRGRPATAGRS